MSTSQRECLKLQLLEMEMLLSMYPYKGEIIQKNRNSILLTRRYLEGISASLPPVIEFSVFIKIQDTEEKAEIHVSLPHTYPNAEPQMFVRAVGIDREQQCFLNTCLASYISSFDRGDLCITCAVQWVQDNISPYFKNSKQNSSSVCERKKDRCTFQRMWISCHHIYCQELRKKIFDFVKRLDLTGFCLTGKPGIICIEGVKENCDEFWRDIHYPNCKSISCKHTEYREVSGKVDNLRLFGSFEELTFAAHGDYGYRNTLRKFLKYLRRHQSKDIFQILFGSEGKF